MFEDNTVFFEVLRRKCEVANRLMAQLEDSLAAKATASDLRQDEALKEALGIFDRCREVDMTTGQRTRLAKTAFHAALLTEHNLNKKSLALQWARRCFDVSKELDNFPALKQKSLLYMIKLLKETKNWNAIDACVDFLSDNEENSKFFKAILKLDVSLHVD